MFILTQHITICSIVTRSLLLKLVHKKRKYYSDYIFEANAIAVAVTSVIMVITGTHQPADNREA